MVLFQTQSKNLLLAACAVVFTGCSSTSDHPQQAELPLIEQIAQCDVSESALAFEKKIIAEHGFKRLTKNTYTPVVGEALTGHEVLIINLEDAGNKIYVSGKPSELAHHLKPRFPTLTCANNSCQAKINNEQTLYIYQATTKKAKDTTVIECTNPELAKES